MSEIVNPEKENAGDARQAASDSSRSSCGPGCECKSGLSRKTKIVICIGILLAAGVVLARSIILKSRTSTDDDKQGFATVLPQGNGKLLCRANGTKDKNSETDTGVTGSEKTASESEKAGTEASKSSANEPSLWREALNSLASLNEVASGTDVVFVLLSSENKKGPASAVREIEAAARTIQSRGSRLAAFTLKKESPDFAFLANQLPAPGVLVMVKGRGMSGVSGSDITESNLLKAFIAASRPASGCGPSSCPPSACK